VSTYGDAEKLHIRTVWLTIGHSVAAVTLGRLRMDLDDCIATYGDLMRAMDVATPSQLSTALISTVVADIVSRCVRSITEAFQSAVDHNCKVFVVFLSPVVYCKR
jgi:hypothetical protein